MDEATFRYRDRDVVLPVIGGSETEAGVDISKLAAETGLFTVDRGFANTAEAESSISFIDGAAGILRYRGYPIEQLAEQSSFIEVAYLLLYGELPSTEALDEFAGSITHHTLLREDMKHLFEAFPHSAHPMQILASATSALATYYPDALNPRDAESVDISCRRLLAKMPTMIAWLYKYRVHQAYAYPRNDLDYPTNFLHMVYSLPTEPYLADPIVAAALNVLLILHADHGQNCSATAVKLVGSGEANIFSSVAAGVLALGGPRHGGANQEVLEMLEAMLEAGGDVSYFVERAKDRTDPFRLMGFGHRIYKNFDPRARIIKKAAEGVLAKLGIDDPLLDIAQELEQVALSDDYFIERRLYPNVDFYSGIIYRALGFPTDMFTVLFALGRLPGWLAQWKEGAEDPNTRIFRPQQIYVGPTERNYVPVGQRASG